ncbi:MAG: RNA polymerase sigma-70 factor [Anaerolineae bacterium]|nr:RNA polymerase sigma-70 factor [Anaerolineae bacterium]NUQ03661.1 RNA polymerase sigma-70 factor [Anaerolineae bacterium]
MTDPSAADAEKAAEFEHHRSLLFGVAYRMLGTVGDAEDVVQEAFLRFRQADEVHSPRPFLVRIVTNLSLDVLKSAREQRETYIGPWLPEPLETALSPQEQMLMGESISMAFLVLMESLSPLERAVYLLREVFSYEYEDIAQMIGRGESACRQLYHRAKAHVSERRPRFAVAPEAHQRVVEQFLTAVGSGDLHRLEMLLAEDVRLWSDGGGKVTAATRPLTGAATVAEFLIGISRGYDPARMTTEIVQVNGSAALLIREGGRAIVVFTFDTDGERLTALRLIRSPDKLIRL